MTPEDWTAVQHLIPDSLRPAQLVTIIMGVFRIMALHHGAPDVFHGWATHFGRVVAIPNRRSRLTSPPFCPDERLSLGLYGMLVRVMNLFFCQRGPYDAHLMVAAMNDAGFEG